MQLQDFQALVTRLAREIPSEFQGGVVAVEVSHKTVPHPVRADIYTLGECIPIEWSGSGADLQSRIVLYHGSFQALANLDAGQFDWRKEAWETLTHELRHHMEWRANQRALEAYDWSAEQNFARHEGQPFDAAFYRLGERIAAGVYKVDDDVFIEAGGEVVWHGRRYRVPITARPPAFLILDGLADPPPGEVVLVLPSRPSLADLWRRPKVTQSAVRVQRVNG